MYDMLLCEKSKTRIFTDTVPRPRNILQNNTIILKNKQKILILK